MTLPSIAPYAKSHADPQGPGDSRPTAFQILQDENLLNALPNLTVLITGATAGIGLETARAIYATGARTFITARDPAKGQKTILEIAGANTDNRLQLIFLDLSSFDSVRKAAASFLEQSKSLNILINNAGLSTPSHKKDESGIEMQFKTNHLGHFLLFELLKPTLLSSSTSEFHSRVVNVASVAHRNSESIQLDDLGLDKIDHDAQPIYGYGHSKLANIYMANEIERRYGSRGLHAFSLQPGGVITELFSEKWDADSIEAAYMGSAPKFVKTTAQGAATTVWAAVGKRLEGKGGLYLENLAVAEEVNVSKDKWSFWWEPGFAPSAYDEVAGKALWEKSCELSRVEN